MKPRLVMNGLLNPDPRWLLEFSEWEFEYFREACARDGNSLATTLSYVVPHWRRIAEAEGLLP